MAVSPFLLFVRKNKTNAALAKLAVPARGKALGKLYKALPAAEKAALIKTAKATPAPKRTKVQKSVLVKAKALGVPSGVVKAAWFKTKGNSTKAKLVAIAKAKNIKIRKVKVVKAAAPKKVVKVAKKAAATKKVAKK